MTVKTAMFSLLNLCCFALSGCWDYKELEQQALLTGLGYDRDAGAVSWWLHISTSSRILPVNRRRSPRKHRRRS